MQSEFRRPLRRIGMNVKLFAVKLVELRGIEYDINTIVVLKRIHVDKIVIECYNNLVYQPKLYLGIYIQ